MAQLGQSTTTVGGSRSGPLRGGLVFLLAYLLVGPAAGALADRDLPLPDAAAGEIAGYYAANPAAALVGAALQLASVAGLLLFTHSIGPGDRPAVAARVAVGAMVVSSILTGVVTVMAGDAPDQTVALLREIGFYAGGVVHVVTVGLFTLLAVPALHQRGDLSRGGRTFGYVAGALAVLSVLSVAIYYANALLPLGRVLCMVWTVTVGVSLWRRRR
jgi:hypothetical protein